MAEGQFAQSLAQPGGLTFGEKVVVLMGGIVAGMSLTVLNPVLPAIQAALAHTPTEQMLVKQLFGAVTLAMVLGAPLGGFLVARIGMRRLLLVASLLFAFGGSAGFFLSSLPLLLVTRLLVGLSAACIQVMALTLVSTKLSGVARAKWMGLHVSIATLCSLLVFPMSGYLGGISWRLPFLEHLFGLVVFAAILVSPVTEPPKAPTRAADAAEPIWNWMPWHYIALTLFTGAITFLPTIYSSFLFSGKFGMGSAEIGIVMLITALTGGVSAMFYGRAMHHLSVHTAFLLAFGFAAVGLLVVTLAPGNPQSTAGYFVLAIRDARIVLTPGLALTMVGLLIYGIGNAWFVPNVMNSLGGKVLPHQQARAAGLVKMGQFGSTPIVVLLVEPYARQYGPIAIMLLASGLAAFIFVLIVIRMATLGKSSLTVAPVQSAGP